MQHHQYAIRQICSACQGQCRQTCADAVTCTVPADGACVCKQVDSLENVSHSLCTLEFESRRASYYWLLEVRFASGGQCHRIFVLLHVAATELE